MPPNVPRNRLLTDAVVTILPKLAGGGLTLLLGLVLIGHLPAADYGHYALAITVIFLADAIAGMPFDLAVLRLVPTGAAGTSRQGRSVEQTALAMKLALSFVAGGLALVTAILSEVDLMGIILVALTVAAATSLLVLRSSLLRMQMRSRFRAYGALELAHVSLKLGPAFALAFTQTGGVAGVLTCLAAGPVLALGLATLWMPDLRILPRLNRTAAAQMLRLLRWYGPTLALGATLARLDILVLSAVAPPETVGIYGAATVIASVPDMLGMYMGVVLTPTVLSMARAGTLRPWFVRMQLALSALALAVLGLTGLAFALGVDALLPSAYAGTLPILAILLPGSVLAMTTSALSLSFVMVARKDWLLRVDAVVAPLALIGYLLAVPGYGAMGAATVAATVTIARSLAVLGAAWRLSARAQAFST